jgi:hypothetical protein
MGLVEEDPEARMLQQGARSLEAVGGRIAEGDHEAPRGSSSRTSPSVLARGTASSRPSL